MTNQKKDGEIWTLTQWIYRLHGSDQFIVIKKFNIKKRILCILVWFCWQKRYFNEWKKIISKWAECQFWFFLRKWVEKRELMWWVDIFWQLFVIVLKREAFGKWEEIADSSMKCFFGIEVGWHGVEKRERWIEKCFILVYTEYLLSYLRISHSSYLKGKWEKHNYVLDKLLLRSGEHFSVMYMIANRKGRLKHFLVRFG